MSRWTAEFAQHPFQATWKALKEELVAIEIDDQTITTSVYELARLKRVVGYLDELIAGIDPEITPNGIWGSFHSQADAALQQVRAYVPSRDISYIVRSNEHADNLLSYVKPYSVIPEKAIKAFERSAKIYASTLESYVNSFATTAAAALEAIDVDKNKANSYMSQADADRVQIEKFKEALFLGSKESPAIANAIHEAQNDIETKSAAINEFYKLLLVGDATVEALETSTIKASTEIKDRRSDIKELLNSVEIQIQQLNTFHAKIFGVKSEEPGKNIIGLEFELEQRTKQLVELEKDQKDKHLALFTKIESLLPGATSAGLASSYRSLKDKFDKPIALYTRFFYGALFLLVLAALVMSIDQITTSPFSISFVKIAEWDFIFKALMYKVPFIAPVIWLAIFSTTRRSQYERLQQEYAHKEALASSYESYKKQLQDLKSDSDNLQKELIAKAIDAIAYNASTTLDGKHEDKLPLQQLLDKFNVEDGRKLLEILRNK